MNKKYIIILLIFIFGICICVDKLLLSNKDIDDGFNDLSQIKCENTLSMMLETEANSGEYAVQTRSSWPTEDDGYVFNSTLSKCENGSKLSWDENNNTVVMVGTKADKCYVYFDKVPLTLAKWVKEQYGAQTIGSETIYLHNSSLANGAGDNSYRYAGANPNNYVCFGSGAETCSDDNLYRIIGVFGDQVKLIKWDYATSTLLGTDGDYRNTYSSIDGTIGTSKGTNAQTVIGAYYWNSANFSAAVSATNAYNVWSYSKLNTVNLNTNFLTNIGTTWANKIATTTWKVGGNKDSNIYGVKAVTAYINEYINPDTTIEGTYNAKIGLMYTSDYGFAAAPSAWTTNLSSYQHNSIPSINWMYMGLTEWTVVRISDYTYYACYVHGGGGVHTGIICNDNITDNAFAIRPVFYLNSNVTYVSGIGTKEDSIRIN